MMTPELVLPLSFLPASARSGELLSQEGGEAGDFAGKYAGAVLKAMSANQGHVRVAELWRQSGVRWEDLLAKDRGVKEFLKDNVSSRATFFPLSGVEGDDAALFRAFSNLSLFSRRRTLSSQSTQFLALRHPPTALPPPRWPPPPTSRQRPSRCSSGSSSRPTPSRTRTSSTG